MKIKDLNNADFTSAISKLLAMVKIDTQHDIPYLAGYSKEWIEGSRTVYIDRHCPLSIGFNGAFAIYKTLVLHEVIEKILLASSDLTYQEAHAIATRVEKTVVEENGIRWADYETFLEPYIKGAAKEKLTKVPADLDLEPYRDMEDFEELKKIAEANICKDCPHIAAVRNVRV